MARGRAGGRCPDPKKETVTASRAASSASTQGTGAKRTVAKGLLPLGGLDGSSILPARTPRKSPFKGAGGPVVRITAL